MAQFADHPHEFLAALIEERALPLDAVIVVARCLAQLDPILDVRLVQALLSVFPEGVARIPAPLLMRVLRIAENVSGCERLSSYLVIFLRHPSPEVRSKATLLIGRANLNLTRVGELLKSPDSRIRANAVESLWGQTDRKVQALLLEAAKDPAARVAVNALVGLYEAGRSEARARLEEMAASPDASVRMSAEWGLRRLGPAGGSATPSEPAAAGITPD